MGGSIGTECTGDDADRHHASEMPEDMPKPISSDQEQEPTTPVTVKRKSKKKVTMGDEVQAITPEQEGTFESDQPKPSLQRAGTRYVAKAENQQEDEGNDSATDEAEDGEDIFEVHSELSQLEEYVQSWVVKYRRAIHNRRKISASMRRALDEKISAISNEMRRLDRGRVSVASTTTSEIFMQTAYLGLKTNRRFRSLRDVVRKVQEDIRTRRILLLWREHLENSSPTSNLRAQLLMSGSMDFEDAIGKLSIDIWDGVNVLELERSCNEPMFQVFFAIWQQHHIGHFVKAKKVKVQEYIKAVDNGYVKANPYHNSAHAAEVTLMTYQIWSYLSQGSFKGYFEQVDLLVVMIAAAIHDIAHPATNNDFLIKTKSPLALRYHDTSILENFHLATAFELMRAREVSLLEHNLPSPPVTSLRRRIVDIVLATDMARHKEQVDDMGRLVSRCTNRQEIDKHKLEQYIVHMADVGHPFRPVAQHQEWARRVNEEFIAQGDREKELGLTPIDMFDRDKAPPLPKNQLGFLQFVIQPLWKPMEELLAQKGRPANLFLQRNIRAWQERIEATAKRVDRTVQKQPTEVDRKSVV